MCSDLNFFSYVATAHVCNFYMGPVSQVLFNAAELQDRSNEAVFPSSDT